MKFFLIEFSFKIPPYNINKIFQEDFKLVKNIGYSAFDYNYDYKKGVRILTYVVKNKSIINRLINNAKKARLPNFRWKINAI